VSFPAVTSAMGWSGRYDHCPCCNEDCKLTHYAPCVVAAHNIQKETTNA